MSNHLELLTKKRIMDEYKLPLAIIDKALKDGELKSAGGTWARHYIPRIQVENLIRKRTGMTVVEDN
jgi:hypothetical protein